jgi:hypothetical protein
VGTRPLGSLLRRLVAPLLGVVLALTLVGPVVAPAAAAPPRATLAACTNNVSFGLISASTTGCLDETSTGHWVTSDSISLNGIPLIPAPGTKLTLDAPTTASPGGRLSVDTSITVLGVTFEKQGVLNWNLPAGNKGDEKNVVSTGSVNGEKLFGFAISGSAEIRIGWDSANNLRYFKFIGNLALPSVFKNGPEQGAGGLTATVGLRVDTAGVHADSVKAQVSNAYIGSLQVKNLCLSYVASGSSTTPCSPPAFGAAPFLECQNPGNVSRWDGSAEVVLPTGDRPSVGVWAGVQNGQFSYAGGQVTHLGNSVPLAGGVYLDHVALAVCITPPPMVFKGSAGINIGPSTNGVAPVTLTGSLKYTDSRPWVLEANGSLQVFGYQVADGFFKYRSDNVIDFGFNLNLDFQIASVEAHVLGWIEARKPVRFNVDGSGRICIAKVACLSGEVTASSEGLAGCITVMEGDILVDIVKDSDWAWYAPWRVHGVFRHWRVRAGAGLRWGGSVQVMGDSCDVGPYRAARSARQSAVGVFKITVPQGQTALVLKAQGADKAPAVELTAPDGTTYTSPQAAAKIVRNRDLFFKDPRSHATQVMIARPVAGEWTLRALNGSTVRSIDEANVDPMPEISAGVGGKGEHRILGYAYERQPLHATRFVEDGSKYEQELGAAAGKPCKGVKPAHLSPPHCGEIHFTPAPGPAGVRHIYAITTMNGEIVRKQLVASYDAPTEPEPSIVPELSVHREGDALKSTWAKSNAPIRAASPIDYDVDINLTDGRRLLDVIGKTKDQVIVPNVATDVGAQVRVAAVRGDDTQGRTRVATLAPSAAAASNRH